MKSWYLEIFLTDEQNEKLKQWELVNGKNGDDLVQELITKFVDLLEVE